ncbi:hypothetical protein ABZS62_11955, partial [Streptomyces sp900116325]
VVREDGRLLAIRRADNGTWELPGGVLELEEAGASGGRSPLSVRDWLWCPTVPRWGVPDRRTGLIPGPVTGRRPRSGHGGALCRRAANRRSGLLRLRGSAPTS